MIKYFFLVGISLFLFVNEAKCQNKDSTLFYFKYINAYSYYKVSTLDSADFFRWILPADNGDNQVNVKEFYTNGKIKLVGKYDSDFNTVPGYLGAYNGFSGRLHGICIAYFPDGKKKSISNFSHGQKDGTEYLYYPNGRLYCIKKYSSDKNSFSMNGTQFNYEGEKILTYNNFAYVECYDNKGIKLCNEGNGKVIVYDDAFRIIVIQGDVKNGLLDGNAFAIKSLFNDSIKCGFTFKKGILMSAVGYDKRGNTHPFKSETEAPRYKNYDIITFVRLFRSYLSVPRDVDKKALDNASFSFVIEKDGSLLNPEVSSDNSPEFQEALKKALARCSGWNPRRYFGIPVTVRLTLPYREFGEIQGNLYKREVEFHELIIGGID